MKKVELNEKILSMALKLGRELNIPVNDIGHALLAKEYKAILVS